MNIYISPHPDDAIISCGGRILKEKEKKQVVINVFCKEYDGLTKWDQLSGNLKNPIKKRVEEDKEILSDLKIATFYLDFYDNAVCADILKKERDEEKEEREIEKKLVEIITSFPDSAKLFFPAGINHQDHILINKIGVKLQKKIQNIYFYEDLPYAFIQKSNLNKEKYLITDVIEKKIDFIFRYNSQIDGLISLAKSNNKENLRKKLINLHKQKDNQFYENLILFER